MQPEIDKIFANFDLEGAQRVKEIENTTKHDVKAIEYFLKEKFDEVKGLSKHKEFLHFSCTSEDINNLSYALMLHHSLTEVLVPSLEKLQKTLSDLAAQNASVPMMSRTHGQSATPTTVGKEFGNYAYRLGKQIKRIKALTPTGKFNGAVGNLNAHILAYPELDWI